MRKDIQIHINTNDLALKHTRRAPGKPFRWVKNSQGEDRYIYGEIDIPVGVSDFMVRNDGVSVDIPYTPVYKEMKFRIRQIGNNGAFTYIRNEKDGGEWFVVKAKPYGKPARNLFASELMMISDTGFQVIVDNNEAVVYSCENTDFNIVDVERQNANCMLACSPSNYYRYPVSGVGLIRWINATDINNTNLSSVLQQEFEFDGMVIKNAVYNYKTHQLELELDNTEQNE